MTGHFGDDFEKGIDAKYEEVKAKKKTINAPVDPEEDNPRSSSRLKIFTVYEKLQEQGNEEAAAEFYECETVGEQMSLADEHLEEMGGYYS